MDRRGGAAVQATTCRARRDAASCRRSPFLPTRRVRIFDGSSAWRHAGAQRKRQAAADRVIAAVITSSPRPLTSARPAVSRQLADVINQAMAKTPADRPSTAGEFARLLESSTMAAVGAPAPASRRGRSAFIGAAAVTVLLAGAYATMRWRGAAMATGERRIAVLPFENAGSADDEYFADGMTDEVRSRLSSIHGIRVTARASSSSIASRPRRRATSAVSSTCSTSLPARCGGTRPTV